MEINDIKADAVNFVHDKVMSMLSVHDIAENCNLIEEGLSSINIMQISNLLRKYNMRIPFAKLIERPALNEWNEIIRTAVIAKKAPKGTDCSNGQGRAFSLTDVQSAYFIGRRDDQPLGGVGCHAYMEFDGQRIEPEKLETAWNVLQKHHPMLRAKFLESGMQEIMPSPYSEKIMVFDLRDLAENKLAKELISIRESLSHRKLNVEQGEVAGISLALLPGRQNRVYLDIDLLIADVLSLSIIICDLAKVYMGQTLASQSEYNFRDFMKYKAEDYSAAYIERDKKFWESKLNTMSIETPAIPLKKKPELVSKTVFSRRKDIISKNEWIKIKQIAAGYKTTPSMVLLTSYALILERWCNQEEFFINLPLFDRNMENENIRGMVADFTNLLLVEFKRRPNEPFLDTLKRVKDTFLENAAHSSYSGISVQRDIFTNIGRTGFIAPFVFACNIDYPLETALSRTAFGDIGYMVSQTPQVWIDFQTYVKDDALVLCWDAVDEIFPEGLLDDMFSALSQLIHTLSCKDNWNKIHDVLPRRQAEQRKTELDGILPLCYPDKTLLSGFLDNVGHSPDRIALTDGVAKNDVTYKNLYDKALKIADLLIESGMKAGDYIGIALPRSCEQIYAIVGILFAGAVYVPISIHQPRDRRQKIYQQTGLRSLVTNTETMDKFLCNEEDLLIVNLDNISDKISLEKPIVASPTDSAYVIMTSGSTGIPKGVEITHETVVNTIADVNQKCNISSKDTAIMVSAIDFDLSVYDVFGMFSSGGRVVVLSEDTYRDPDLWLALIEQYAISVWNSVPKLFDMLVTMAESRKRSIDLRVVMLSGDWIGLDLPQRFYNLSNDSTVIAMGGATEASIWSNYIIVPATIPLNWTSIPYGKPLKNQIYRVVDDFNRVCPNYVHGELWIGGAGVAKGYKGDKKLTAEKFITDTINWYRTGDKGRTWDDGTIELSGRTDNQVKISGYRIEIGEIESALLKLPYIANAVVCVIEENADKKLAAYIVLKNEIDIKIIKESLEAFLPQYMIPSKFFMAEELPLTDNGKPDKVKIIESLEMQCNTDAIVFLQSAVETEIENVWKEVLQMKSISRMDNFFRLGGDSLKAVEMVTKIGKALRLTESISIQALFRSPTIWEFALEVDKLCSDYEEASV